MLEELFNMWLEGVKIIISFIPFSIFFILLTVLPIIAIDLLVSVVFSDLDGEIELIITKNFIPKELYDKIYNFLNRK